LPGARTGAISPDVLKTEAAKLGIPDQKKSDYVVMQMERITHSEFIESQLDLKDVEKELALKEKDLDLKDTLNQKELALHQKELALKDTLNQKEIALKETEKELTLKDEEKKNVLKDAETLIQNTKTGLLW